MHGSPLPIFCDVFHSSFHVRGMSLNSASDSVRPPVRPSAVCRPLVFSVAGSVSLTFSFAADVGPTGPYILCVSPVSPHIGAENHLHSGSQRLWRRMGPSWGYLNDPTLAIGGSVLNELASVFLTASFSLAS